MSSLTLAPYSEVERQQLDNALVFVHSLPSRHLTPGAWVPHHRNPLPDLSDRVLFMRDAHEDRGERERSLIHRAGVVSVDQDVDVGLDLPEPLPDRIPSSAARLPQHHQGCFTRHALRPMDEALSMTHTVASRKTRQNCPTTGPTVVSSFRHGLITAARRLLSIPVQQQIYHIRCMRQRLVQAALVLASVLLFTAFWVSAEWADGYLMRYGNFLPSRGDLALKLNLLLFVLPATALLGWVLARSRPNLSADFDRIGRHPNLSAWFVALALVALALVMSTRLAVLRSAPITDDEHVYEFQARILATGRLYLDSLPPPIRPFFDNQFVVNNGKWYGLYFFGHPALLGVAMRVGLFEWLGAIQAALTVLLACGIARRLFGSRAAILSGALLVASPFFISLSASHLSQPSSILMLSLFAYGALRIEETPSGGRWWIVSATALAYGFLIRPQTALFFSLPFLARLAWLRHVGRLRGASYGPAVAALVLALGAAAFLAINHALTGSAFRTGYQAYMDQGRPWMFPVGPYYTIRESFRALTELNFWLLGWPTSLIFVPFFERRGAAVPIATIPALAVAWYGAIAVPTVAAVGPVYYGECIVPLIILSASGMEQLVARARHQFHGGTLAQMLVAWPPIAVVGAFLSFVPVQVTSLGLMADIVRAPYDLVEQQRLDNALVFVHSLPALHTAPGAWAYYHRNPLPDLSDRVLFVRYLGPEKNKDLVRYWPHRIPHAMGMRDGKLVLERLHP